MTYPKGRAQTARQAARAALASACALALAAGCGWAVRPLPAPAQEAASAVQDVTLQDVSLPFGATVLTAPKVTVSGTRLSRDDLMGILKADSPEPWAARLARLDAASLTIPELRTVHAGPGDARQTVVYRDVTARDVRAGRIAELTASGAAITVAGGPDSGSGSYGRIAATGVDLAAMARLYGVPGDGKGPLLTLYATLSIADLAYTDEKGTAVKLAALSGRDLGGRQVPGGWTGAVEALSRLDPDSLEGPERAKAAATVADLIEGVSAGAVEAKGLSVAETKGPEPLTFEIGRMAFALPAAGQKAQSAASETGFTLEGIALSKGGMRTRIEKITLAGFSLAPTVAALRQIAVVDPKKPDAPVPEGAMRRLTPAIGTLTLDGMSLDLPPEEAPTPAPPPVPAPEAAPPKRLGDSLDDAVRGAARAKGADRSAAKAAPPVAKPGAAKPAAAPVHVGLRNATMTFGPPREGVPTSSRLSLAGLTMPAASVASVPGLGGLSAYGYGDLDLDAVVDSSWDEGKREVLLREVSVAGKDMGSVRLAGTIGGIGPELFDPDAATSGLAMLSATAKALDLSIENTGLFERFIAAQSKTLSLKPDELRQEYVTASTLGVPVILGNSPSAKAIGAAMGQFVTKPGKLTLSARAKDANGLGVAEFSTAGSPGAVLDKLDVTAKAE
ncbi:hypothetical protein [Methylobacterium sp. sgz302541]|uniref:hypothetical protein n=1 Tax=unclassified Methylobacterium TaxID=2615210 RepID=UPI003D32587B